MTLRPVAVKMEKGQVKGHYRTVEGKRVRVDPYTTKRVKKPKITVVKQAAQGVEERTWKALGTRSPWFKRWFGDWERNQAEASKVVDRKGEPEEEYHLSRLVDKKGEPQVVYHGTTRPDFTAFDKKQCSQMALYGIGFYFTENEDVALTYQRNGKASHIVKAYLNIRKPFDIDNPPPDTRDKLLGYIAKKEKLPVKALKQYREHPGDSEGSIIFKLLRREDVREWLRKEGFDGLTHIGGYLSDGTLHRVWIAWEPNQIKAINNVGTFDPTEGSIYKALAILRKGRRKAHPRHLETGRVTQVRATTTKTTKKPKPSPRPRKRGVAVQAAGDADTVHAIPFDQIQPDPEQHRKKFDPEQMQELIDSIAEVGQKTAIKVRPIEGKGKVKYQIIAGERRWRACKELGLPLKAQIVTDATEEDVLTEQVIENVNRAEVTAMEEATAYRQLADLYIRRAKQRKKWRGKDFADRKTYEKLEDEARAWVVKQTGKSGNHVSFYIKLKDLPDEVQEMVERGSITPRHANALTRLTEGVYDKSELKERVLHQTRMARHIRAQGLSVTDADQMITKYIGHQQQGTLFGVQEMPGTEKQETRRVFKERFRPMIAAVIKLVNTAWSAKGQEFKIPGINALSDNDLQVLITELDGTINSFGDMRGVVEGEMLNREMRESVKRRISPQRGQTTLAAVAKSLTSVGDLRLLREACLQEATDRLRIGPPSNGLCVMRKAGTPRLSQEELAQRGLRWITVHPGGKDSIGSPVLVKCEGGECMVVGGAGGKLNYLRFKEPADKFAPKRQKPSREVSELTAEELERLEGAKGEAEARRKEQQERLTATIREQLGITEEALAPGVIARLAERARKRAEAAGADKAEAEEFSTEAVAQYQEDVKAAEENTAKLVARAAIDALAKQELTGESHEVEVRAEDATGKLKTYRMNSSQAATIAEQLFALRQLQADERAVGRALRRGNPQVQNAVDILAERLSPDRVRELALEEYIDREQVEVNTQLMQIASPHKIGSQREMYRGAVDAGAGMVAELTGETILHADTAEKLGITGSARAIAHHLATKYDRDATVTAIREFIANEGAASAATAVAKSNEFLKLAGDMRGFGGELMTQNQAHGKALQYLNQARFVCARSLGALQTMQQVAVMLEQDVQGPLLVAGRSSVHACRELAKELGLKSDDYGIGRNAAGQYVIRVRPESIDKLVDPHPFEEWEGDEEIREIKVRGRRQLDPETDEFIEPRGWSDEEWRCEDKNPYIILAPHQQADIMFWEKQKSILVGDEVGSGKTAVALNGIGYLARQGKVKKALVVVPKNILQQFRAEADKFLEPDLAARVRVADADKMRANERAQLYQGDQLITVVTHDEIRNNKRAIMEAGFDALVVDEAHYFTLRGGAEGSRRSRDLRDLQPEYKLLMSGTPTKNDLSELYSLIDYLQPGLLGERNEFMARYEKLGQGAGPMDYSLLRSLQHKLDGAFIGIKLQTRKVEGGNEVFVLRAEPEPAEPVELHRKVVNVDLSPEQTKQYNQREQEFLKIDKVLRRGAALSKLDKQRKIVNNLSPKDNQKVQAVADIMATHEGETVIIFATNLYAIRTIREGLGLRKDEVELIDGSVSAGPRLKIAERVNGPNPPKVLFATDAGNFGINMQGASVVINFDVPDTQATVDQRAGRAFRRGQKRNVINYQLATNTPLEIDAQQRLVRKKATMAVADQLAYADETGVGGALRAYLEAGVGA